MAEPLKNMFNIKFFEHLAEEFSRVHIHFKPEKFVIDMMENIAPLSLNERMRKTSIVLKTQLPLDYKKSMGIMIQVIPKLKKGYTSLVFPDFVGLYGHNDFILSMEALKYFTQFGSSEFAIREFLRRDFKKTINIMDNWAADKNYHVRRLASEGSRPRLPWSFKLDEVIKNPGITQSILEKLKADDDKYVMKSVANHLNDISKDNVSYLLNILRTWDKTNPNTLWIIKHASRTLIKKGNSKALLIFDFKKNIKINVINFKLNKSRIYLGEYLQFEFSVVSRKLLMQKLVIDFAIHYLKKSGELSAKVFKLKQVDLLSKQTIFVSKKIFFKDFTTRKHYFGIHRIEILINGKSFDTANFELLSN